MLIWLGIVIVVLAWLAAAIWVLTTSDSGSTDSASPRPYAVLKRDAD